MIISNVNKSTTNNRTRVSADVIWENCDRPTRNIYIETEAEFGEDLNYNPNSFVLGTILPAMFHGERRLKIEGKVCPILRNGLITAIQILRSWYGEARHGDVTIEPTQGFASAGTRKNRVSSFMSGGVDALTTLYINRRDHPLDHPASIKDCFFVHGIDIGGYVTDDGSQANSAKTIESLRPFTQKSNATLIPVWTNLRHLDDSDSFFHYQYYGSVLASIAHAFHQRIGHVKVASGSSVEDLSPHGSHPLLEPNFSSYDLSVYYDALRVRRFEKVGLISQWPEALSTLRACFNPFRPADAFNCNKCEKCFRTMTELLIHGKLSQVPTYKYNDVTTEMIEKINSYPLWMLRIFNKDLRRMDNQQALDYTLKELAPASMNYWKEMVEPLQQMGRSDLANIIKSKCVAFERVELWLGRIKHWDRRLLGRMISKSNSFLTKQKK